MMYKHYFKKGTEADAFNWMVNGLWGKEELEENLWAGTPEMTKLLFGDLAIPGDFHLVFEYLKDGIDIYTSQGDNEPHFLLKSYWLHREYNNLDFQIWGDAGVVTNINIKQPRD